MIENRKVSNTEHGEFENTQNKNELKTGKKDSPDFNGVGINEQSEAAEENNSSSPKTKDESDSGAPKAWENYTDEPISGATEA